MLTAASAIRYPEKVWPLRVNAHSCIICEFLLPRSTRTKGQKNEGLLKEIFNYFSVVFVNLYMF